MVVGWALYALVSYPHRGWYSWVVGSLADAVYLFGFVMMTPQLFINYKLRSVAHLPWRVLMYKAFNTFIDDAFALMVPTHMYMYREGRGRGEGGGGPYNVCYMRSRTGRGSRLHN